MLQKCKHGRRQNGWFCQPCGGGGSCEHQHNKYRCPTCRPARLGSYSDPTCEHGYASGRNCPRCKRSGFCSHGNRKPDCPQCNNCICDIEGCSMRGHRYAGPVNLLKHMRAFHGDNPKALTKSKELEVHQLLSKSGIQFDYQDYQHHLPFRGCGLESETFADFVLYAAWGEIILQVDENQHSHQDPSCDVRRDFDMAASVALGSQHKLAIVRYNPDAFKVTGRTVRTPKTERHPGRAGATLPAPLPLLRPGGRGQRAARRRGRLGRGGPDCVSGRTVNHVR